MVNEKRYKLKNRIVSALVLVLGGFIITAWTLFRFSTQTIKYDIVGQQLLAHQWIEGNFGGSVVGPTNYIVKMLTVYMPADILHLNPKLFLIISTIIINIVTFIGLYFVLKAILRYFNIRLGAIFNVLMLWLATIFGSVFWVQFTNSRNLELVAGLLVLYLGLLVYRTPSINKYVGFIILASLTFFADPMQLYVTASILTVYILFNSAIYQRNKWKTTFAILSCIVSSYLLSIVYVYVMESSTHISFSTVGSLSQSIAILGHIPTVVLETSKNFFRLFGGFNEMGIWRQLINILLVGMLMVFSIVILSKNRKYLETKNFILFIAAAVVVPIAIYVASGQALSQDDSSRYLIVLAPSLVLLFSFLGSRAVSKNVQRSVIIIIALVVTANIFSLLGVTVNTYNTKFAAEDVLKSKYNYLLESDYSYGYASMDSAISADYLFGQSSVKVLLPLSCGPEGIKKATLFFDRNVFLKKGIDATEAPIILDGQSIANYPHVCGIDLIKKQLGEPIKLFMYHGDTVLLYKSETLAQIDFSVAAQ